MQPSRRRTPVTPARLTPAELHALLPESDFQKQVVGLAERAGWWWWHDVDARRNKGGLPDLILIKAPRVLFVELKREKGRTRPKQAVVLEMLSRCPGIEVYKWRPSDWDTVVDVLTRTKRTPPRDARDAS